MGDPSGCPDGHNAGVCIERAFPMTFRKMLTVWSLCLVASWGILQFASIAGLSVFKAETVSGVVSYKGEPLARGVIYFSPVKEGDGVLAYGWIRDGRYALDPARFKAEDHNVRYQVSVIPITKDAGGRWRWRSAPPNALAAPTGELVTLAPSASNVDVNLN